MSMKAELDVQRTLAPLEQPELFRNPHRASTPDYRPSVTPARLHASMEGYAPTPLRECPAIARQLGIDQVLVKDESDRLGTKSFKILGPSWAIYKTLSERFGVFDEERPRLAAVREVLEDQPDLELVCATDGNHGLAVAMMAERLGIPSRILVPQDMVKARREALLAAGATVEIVPGTYDDAVRASASIDSASTVLVSDTSWPDYTGIPAAIQDGYSTLGLELRSQLQQHSCEEIVVAVQIGVGAFASAVIQALQYLQPTVLAVEPTRAPCGLLSAKCGEPVAVEGSLDSIMAGLNCGRLSTLAWPVVRDGVDFFAAIDDEQACDAMRLLAAQGIEAGESGAAGLAGVIAFTTGLSLTPNTTVVVINTEGATDPDGYARIVEVAQTYRDVERDISLELDPRDSSN